MLTKILNANPNKIAYIIKEEQLTYGTLLTKAKSSALNLKKEGTSPVIIYGHKSPDMIVSMLACLLANRPYVIVDTSTPKKYLEEIINETKATLIIKNAFLPQVSLPSYTLEELNIFKNNQEKESNNNLAYIIFTSGTTGKPKGILITKENLNNFFHWISNLYPLNQFKNIKVLNQANFNFDLSVADIYYSLGNGMTLIGLDNPNDYSSIFNTIKTHKPHLLIVTPTFINLLLLDSSFLEENYSFIKCIYFCGETLSISLVKKLFHKFPNIQIINAYGPSEATSAISAILITKEMVKEELLPVGDMKNLATKVEIIHNEIVLSGPSVFFGYLNSTPNYNNPYFTKDLGYIKDNKLYCLGRKDRQIKYKGYRIELDGLENIINQIKGVEAAFVKTTIKDNQVKFIKAYVKLQDNFSVASLKEQLTTLLPEYMLPKVIKKIETIPLTKNGKINRKELQ